MLKTPDFSPLLFTYPFSPPQHSYKKSGSNFRDENYSQIILTYDSYLKRRLPLRAGLPSFVISFFAIDLLTIM